MKIKEGKYYRTRGGDVVGPMRKEETYSLTANSYPWVTTQRYSWTIGGSFSAHSDGPLDLISEVYVSDTPPADAPAPEAKTLRDEFAMAALQGMLARESDLARNVARYAYEYADAMMEARKK